ncbi:ferrichrome ABC transporter permease [Lapidilactobacillus dextrinicus DSM 20335]|uniref:Ferrichrome ABC transporter permease n=1 Tax=Lapidilactobacillus dextrinicus DSM 20335 TaxID=1423738 RepID=A0A0R2BK58_9LACO|nr:iron ABC transporter permease [Lapidilactobacillus dextrinicus]KRM79917.1 ferrichrome ABC transporter permease [Lapidilactobacillus dextrinicus DSM 20335]QFG46302.1 iron ABC transporter permease [Lapidilactobacillus dextrinicus]
MSKQRIVSSLVSCVLILVLLGVALLALGEIRLDFISTLLSLIGQSTDQMTNLVVWQIRMPYLGAALITGSCLAISGLILQTLTENPLVDSSILGINAGASLGAVILIGLASQSKTLNVDNWLPRAALIGALLSFIVVSVVSRHGAKMQILLSGVALTALLNGIILMIELSLNKFDFEKILVWLSGSFWNTDRDFLLTYGVLTVVLLLLTWSVHTELETFLLGPAMARSIGVNVAKMRYLLLALAVGLAAIAVSVGGAISIVGLMAPRMAKRLVGSQMRVLVPVSCCLGCIIMVLSTLVANNLFLPSVLPVGLVTGVITMPYFLYLLFKSN